MSPQDKNAPETIILVEDELDVRSFALSLLKKAGYTVITAVDGIDAMEKASKFGGSIDLLLSDLEMPRMTGVELATQIFLQRPDTRILLMSGLPSGLLILNQDWQFLPKPFVASMRLAKNQAHLEENGRVSRSSPV